MSQDWLNKRATYSSKAVVCEVEGQKIDFYPLSSDGLLALKPILKTIGKIIAFVTSNDGQKDQHFKQVLYKDPATGEENTVVETQPINKDMAEFRATQRIEAVDGFIESLLSPEVRDALGIAIIDSMRPRDDTTEVSLARASEWVRKLDLSVLKQYLSAVAKANGALLGPLAGQLGGLKERATQLLNEKVKSLDPSGSLKSPSENGSDDEKTRRPIPLRDPEVPASL